MSEESTITQEQQKAERARQLYLICKRLCADKEFIEVFWEFAIGDKLAKADGKLRAMSTQGEDLVTARAEWSMLQDLLALPQETVDNYEKLHNQESPPAE